MTKSKQDPITFETLPQLLENDTKVKVAGIDVDGILRGKLISKEKFLSVAENGFGFCSVIFGWDMHDQVYSSVSKISVNDDGISDILVYPDLKSFRRIPWENNVPFFIVSFFDPVQKIPFYACPRGLLKVAAKKLNTNGFKALAGVEYEFANFRVPQVDHGTFETNHTHASVAKFLQFNTAASLPPLTEGKFGYSMTRSVQNSDYFYEIFNTCEKFNCSIEGWHSESGPGIFEAALTYDEALELADKASLFKYVVKSIATNYGVTPCFMAKPQYGLPGNSGHMHVSLVDKNGRNIFAREEIDKNAKYEDIANLSDLGRYFLAGLLDGLPDIMPMFAPTINSYKRLDENYWAPATVSWGLEHRLASIRVITPPISKSEATRFEVRVPGADSNPYFVLATIISLGWRGIEKKLENLPPPLAKGDKADKDSYKPTRLARTLREANNLFMKNGSVAREVFGDQFVQHFGGTREHEIQLWEQAVTDWEIQRYIETV
ncbi:Type-1 glutamine synthetase 2 [Erysiphe necator]|uniref:Glutamine synthetase n=1 Tax=Uncinula necator TaxID=52586 RepID=A0A0B1PHS3_UNCNE|nr:Type-1 glutamine synthetase 2 [Erysiphe necator]KHJ36336.1 putative glutamine synthetase [Erysiphe necator]